MTQWTRVGLTDPCTLTTERTMLHHAVQVLAAFGQALVTPRDDDSHRATRWDPATRGFRSDPSADGIDAVISLVPFRLEVWRSGRPMDGVGLDEMTPEAALAWLRTTLRRETADPRLELSFPDWDIPACEGDGGALQVSEAAREEMSRWYDNAHRLLTRIADRTTGASEVRCWPHHFDIATLVTYPAERRDAEPRYTGIGLSPGDRDYPQPYLYVNAWPAPDADALRPLEGPGHWHTDGWTAGVLPAERIVELDDPEAQCELVDGFLDTALLEARRALGVEADVDAVGPR